MKKIYLLVCLFFMASSTLGFSVVQKHRRVSEHEIKSYVLLELNFPMPELILAVVRIESSQYSGAVVFDKGCNCYTYGLMQLQYDTARMMGFRGHPSKLFDWKTNLTYGVKYLVEKLDLYEDIPTALSAYNAGAPLIKCETCAVEKRFKNSKYVKKVLNEFQGLLNGENILDFVSYLAYAG